MLTLYHNGEQYPLENTEYYIRELANGLDEVIFSLPLYDPIYALLNEEEQITDRGGQRYKVKQIDAGARDVKVVCQLDLDEWRATLNVDYNSGTKTVNQQLSAVLPAGWLLNDRAHINIGRTIEGDLTPFDVAVECTNLYNVYIRWDNKAKECTIYPKAMGTPVGSFATRELNLKEINYKGKSNDIVTRLYAYGKDGMSFASINGGKAYVDNFDYTSQIICGIWRDERYTVAADLLADAQSKLARMSKPVRTYECSIIDLQATNPALYNNLDFSLFTVATLIDDVKENAVDYQVVERHIFPYHPEKNEVIFNDEPLKITASVMSVIDSIENPNSTYSQIQQQRIASATNWLTSGDGYVVAKQGANGEWKELLFMDTDDEVTAQKVIRINENGIGFSTTGVNGPYTNAWTIDGQLVADFITTGTLTANLIKAGILTDQQGKFSLNMQDGTLSMQDGTFTGTITGSTITGGSLRQESGGNIVDIANGILRTQGTWIMLAQDLTDVDKRHLALGNENSAYIDRSQGYQRTLSSKWIIEAAHDAEQGSDRKLKHDINAIPKEMSRRFINDLNPVSFIYNSNPSDTMKEGTRYGFIAQDVREALDKIGASDAYIEHSRYSEDGTRTLEYRDFIAHIVNVIQSQQSEINTLKAEINILKEAVNG